MALIRIDSFTYTETTTTGVGIPVDNTTPVQDGPSNNEPGAPQTFRYLASVYYDDETLEITAEMANEQGEGVTPPMFIDQYKTNRVFAENQQIFRFCEGTFGHTFKASYSYPYAFDVVEENATFCVNTNPFCDLTITGILKQNEDGEGANNGSITVSATSTNGPIKYRVNEGAWRVSNEFTGLEPRTYKVDAEDALGCFKTQNVTVESSRQILVETPALELPSGNVSRWSAVFNPIVFRYQRKDYRVTFMREDYGAFMVVYLNKELTEAEKELFADARVFIKTETRQFHARAFNVFYNDRPGETGISVTDFPQLFTEPDDSSGYLNVLSAKIGHRFVTEITLDAAQPGQNKTIVTARHSANPQGEVRAVVSKYLKPVLAARDDFKYLVLNERDTNLSASYTVRYREEWDNGAGEWASAGDPFYVTFSALQMGNEHGSNMAKYVPFAYEPNASRLAHFLTEYREPVFYLGLPFDLAFIYSEDLIGKDVYVKEQPLGVNYQSLGGPVDSALLNENGAVLLNENGGRLMNTLSIEADDVTVVPQLGVNRLRLSGLYPAQARYISVYLYVLDGAGNEQRITQIQRVKILKKPNCDFKYIKWLNPVGGWSYALFEYKIEHDLDVSDTVMIDRYVDDFSTQNTAQDVISREAGRKETVGRNGVPADELKALSSVFYSVKVYVLTQENPRQWQTVIVDSSGKKGYNTKDEAGDFEMTYRLPSLNLQHQ